MTDLEIAKKLAAITGKPLEEYYSGPETIDKQDKPTVSNIKEIAAHNVSGSGDIKVEEHKIETESDWSEEIIAYQKMFAGSVIVKGKILNGRQMTKKEYNKYTKGMTIEEYYGHPLMYKMYRSEGQIDPSFMTFPERFK